jgi:sulfate permease, SulP family
MTRHPFPFQNIVVGLTATEADEGLLRYARLLCTLGANPRLHFVHVQGAGDTGPGLTGEAAQAHVRISAAVRHHFTGEFMNGRISCHVLQGPRIDRLLEFGAREGADLVLVGHRRDRSGRRSMARRLAMNAACSLWMVPDGAEAAISRVLAAVDLSRHSAYAFRAAAGVAAAAGVPACTALHVYFNEVAIGGSEPSQELRRASETDLQRFLDPLDASGVAVEPKVEERYSVPAAIMTAVRQHGTDLVVMGTRGRSNAAAVLLGSESEQVIRESAVPVLIVKPTGERNSLLEVLLSGNLRAEPVAVG